MPYERESTARLERLHGLVCETFERNLEDANGRLKEKGFEIVKYFNGVLGKGRSKRLLKLFSMPDVYCRLEEVRRQSIVLLEEGQPRIGVPDYVVRRIGTKGFPDHYPALIEFSMRIVEVHESEIYGPLSGILENFECALRMTHHLRGFEINLVRCFD
ncbi:MAG: hypothetical protein HZA36_00440 [Parcubacteria group bacterium]|nr:hypothetical protein [Parcubacteria group bacterium]